MKDRIVKIRKDAGLSQEKFADSLNLSRNFVSRMETGDRIPSDRTIKDICMTYGVDEEWLLTGKGEMSTPETKSKKIAKIVSQLYGADENSFEFKLATALSDLSVEDMQKVKAFIKSLSEYV